MAQNCEQQLATGIIYLYIYIHIYVYIHIYIYVGDCQNYDPFLGTLHIRCQRDHNFDNHRDIYIYIHIYIHIIQTEREYIGCMGLKE